MSKKEKVVLQCADCRNQFNAEIWTEINLKDEELDHKLFTDQINRKKSLKVSYNLHGLKFEIQRWRGEPFTPYTGPPEEADIEEGLAKGFITKKEAAKLRGADWESIEKKMYLEGFMEKKPVDFDHVQDEVLDIYFRFQLELDRSTKIIELSKVKK